MTRTSTPMSFKVNVCLCKLNHRFEHTFYDFGPVQITNLDA